MHIARTTIALAGVAFVSTLAAADVTYMTFMIEATNADGTAYEEVAVDDGFHDPVTGDCYWDLSSPIALLDTESGEAIATIFSAHTFFVSDPVAGLGFSVAAGGDRAASTPRSTPKCPRQ